MWDSLSHRVPDIVFPTCIEKLEDEIVIIWIPIPLSSQGLDFVIDALDPPCRDIIGCMGYDPLEMIVQQSSEPEQVLVAGSHAHVHDFCDRAGHGWLIGHLVGLGEFLLDQVQGEQKPVLLDEVLIPVKMTGFPHHWFLAEKRAFFAKDLPVLCLFVRSHKGLLGRGEDVSASLEGPCSLLVSLCLQPSLLILADLSYHLAIEVLDDMKEIEDHLDLG